MVRKKILRGLTVITLVATGALVVTPQPAAAAIYKYWKLESVNSVKAGTPRAMAVQNASTGNNAPVIQYTYVASQPYNDIMTMEIEPNGMVRIKPQHTFSPDGNPHNDKCLAVKNNEPGFNQPIVSANCSYDSINNDVWELLPTYLGDFGPAYLLRSWAFDTCIVVQNASTQNNAALITHTCDNAGDNHFWRANTVTVIGP